MPWFPLRRPPGGWPRRRRPRRLIVVARERAEKCSKLGKRRFAEPCDFTGRTSSRSRTR